MTRVLGTILAGLVGLAFGSFLNVCLSRWPTGESIVHPRSHCRSCGRTLAWWENVPLVSWLALRGRCRSCRAWISWRYPLVELAVGALWAYITWLSSPAILARIIFAPQLHPSAVCLLLAWWAIKMSLCWILVALAILDAENLWLPDRLTYTGTALGYIFYVTHPTFYVTHTPIGSRYYDSWPQLVPGEILHSSIVCIVGILAAAGLILLIRWVYWLIRRREGIGLGDAKLMAMLAAWLGLRGALLSFGLGVVLGAVAALVLLVLPSTRKSSEGWAHIKLPLGTFLCVGGIVSSLWGERMIDAYLRWAGL
ncbi:MAG: prepilin peptidase [Terracidiphilus sp.]|jgi:leader peptidase (prepilin peptidase)/N-methyltransferase